MTGDDERLLERTLELAQRGRRTASPNPVVGCVIVRDGEVLGEGWHVRPGERHAETNALLACRDGAAGATA
ncbi:MAG: diaminohydroxyphosphoribosylaminopyrimidine deaminase, partial [Gaiellales bacterium]|nr:diaminohydroxyphosphoribosylaminopyrimidine deaminase [Gaiellales bacterium]